VWYKDDVTSADLSSLISQEQVMNLAEKVLKFINIKEGTWLQISQEYLFQKFWSLR